MIGELLLKVCHALQTHINTEYTGTCSWSISHKKEVTDERDFKFK